MNCKKCGNESTYPVCSNCANEGEKKSLVRLEEIDRFINDELFGIKDVKKMRGTKSRNMALGIFLTLAGLILIWVGKFWYSIAGFFVIVPGMGFLVAGIIDVFPDKLAKMDYMEDSKKRLRLLHGEKASLIKKTKIGGS